jgi:hypothetical protein
LHLYLIHRGLRVLRHDSSPFKFERRDTANFNIYFTLLTLYFLDVLDSSLAALTSYSPNASESAPGKK